jgi:hypothetical protein
MESLRVLKPVINYRLSGENTFLAGIFEYHFVSAIYINETADRHWSEYCSFIKKGIS